MVILKENNHLKYNLIEYSANYSDTSGKLWDFKWDETVNNADMTNDNNAPYLNIKQILLVILKQMEQKKSKNSCTTKMFK